jgi:predicted ATP-grasp superfamily ATP-dependent carboligase
MPREQFEQLLQSDSDDEPWLLQQYIPGIACSVGFIGSGHNSPPLILLPAFQDLQFRNGIPHYCGGQIPCEPDLSVVLQNVAQKIALCLGGFSGYLGADIVVSHDASGAATAHVIEINPRLCTSYAGYRGIAETNLASLLLREDSDREIRWRKAVVRFDSAGNIHADASGHQKSVQPLDNPGIEQL